MIIFYI